MPFSQGYLLLILLTLLSLGTVGCSPSSSIQVLETQPMEKSLQWQLPTGWVERYDGDGIRWGSFYNKGLDAAVTVTRFPGGVGDEISNINRWRTQVELPAITSAEMTTLDNGNLRWRWAWIEGGKQIIAGAMASVEGTILVFKLTAPVSASKESLRADFIKILQEAQWK